MLFINFLWWFFQYFTIFFIFICSDKGSGGQNQKIFSKCYLILQKSSFFLKLLCLLPTKVMTSGSLLYFSFKPIWLHVAFLTCFSTFHNVIIDICIFICIYVHKYYKNDESTYLRLQNLIKSNISKNLPRSIKKIK